MKYGIFIFLFLYHFSAAQTVELLTTGTKTSIRGLSVVNDNILWVSGSNGKVGKSIDGGKSWDWMTVKGFEKTDFRDIEAFDEKTAVIMGIAEPAYILKTFNGGESWKLVYTDSTKGIFLDAMDFFPDGRGVVIGDPINGRMYMARTIDNGSNWQRTAFDKLPELAEGEAFFASSGTNVRPLNYEESVIVTSGKKSRLYMRGKLSDMPILQGGESTGANSITVWNRGNKVEKMVVVGGDFGKDTLKQHNCYYTTNLGKTWVAPTEGPHGYRSCVEFIDKNTLIACGTSGVDISKDGAKTWQLISPKSFHVCRMAKEGTSVYLAGSNGTVAKLIKP
jgi:photosystem II stability/assembly factor-like uncharacterized protein